MLLNIEIIPIFIITCLVSAMSPGPGMVAVISSSLNIGAIRTIPLMLGMSTGLTLVSIIANTGIGIVLVSDEAYFTLLVYFSAGYIMYLGCKSIYNSKASAFDGKTIKQFNYLNGLTISITSPKTLIFFTAFFPAFIDKNYDYVGQVVVLTTTLILSTIFVHVVYAVFVEKISSNLEKYIEKVNIAIGFLFISIGVSVILTNTPSM
ncbi:MAG: homoserine/homoserine lactone efflux protein [Motiliproteus sp.]|jgi:homoserine/homoserine lactone efflux protein